MGDLEDLTYRGRRRRGVSRKGRGNMTKSRGRKRGRVREDGMRKHTDGEEREQGRKD